MSVNRLNTDARPTTSFHPAARVKYRMVAAGVIEEYIKLTQREKCIGWVPVTLTDNGFSDANADSLRREEFAERKTFAFIHAVKSSDHTAWTYNAAKALYDRAVNGAEEFKKLNHDCYTKSEELGVQQVCVAAAESAYLKAKAQADADTKAVKASLPPDTKTALEADAKASDAKAQELKKAYDKEIAEAQKCESAYNTAILQLREFEVSMREALDVRHAVCHRYGPEWVEEFDAATERLAAEGFAFPA